MALASYLDHQQLKARKCHVYPSDELLASQIGRSSKTVARVLDYLLRAELLVLVRAEVRPGRDAWGDHLSTACQSTSGSAGLSA
jgi:hypothetical protein